MWRCVQQRYGVPRRARRPRATRGAPAPHACARHGHWASRAGERTPGCSLARGARAAPRGCVSARRGQHVRVSDRDQSDAAAGHLGGCAVAHNIDQRRDPLADIGDHFVGPPGKCRAAGVHDAIQHSAQAHEELCQRGSEEDVQGYTGRCPRAAPRAGHEEQAPAPRYSTRAWRAALRCAASTREASVDE